MTVVEVNCSSESNVTYTQSFFQYDGNVKLIINGLDLPERYEVHFSNFRDYGVSLPTMGDTGGVIIPNAFFMAGRDIYAYVTTGTGQGGGTTSHLIVIPIIPRPAPVVDLNYPRYGIADYTINENDENLIFHNGDEESNDNENNTFA